MCFETQLSRRFGAWETGNSESHREPLLPGDPPERRRPGRPHRVPCPRAHGDQRWRTTKDAARPAKAQRPVEPAPPPGPPTLGRDPPGPTGRHPAAPTDLPEEPAPPDSCCSRRFRLRLSGCSADARRGLVGGHRAPPRARNAAAPGFRRRALRAVPFYTSPAGRSFSVLSSGQDVAKEGDARVGVWEKWVVVLPFN